MAIITMAFHWRTIFSRKMQMWLLHLGSALTLDRPAREKFAYTAIPKMPSVMGIKRWNIFRRKWMTIPGRVFFSRCATKGIVKQMGKYESTVQG